MSIELIPVPLFFILQVPFIAFYRKEYVEPELNINDLWKVWQWDEKVNSLCCVLHPLYSMTVFVVCVVHINMVWPLCVLPQWTQLRTRKQNLTRLFQRMQSYQFEQISADPDKPLADAIRPLDTADMER